MPLIVTPEEMLKEADRCVKCGLCLSVCPTYRLLAHEADSPRGRISLLQALASGELAAGGPLSEHLERCLTCRLCESACPSGVRYGDLMDAGRNLLNRQRAARRGWRLLYDLLSERRRLGRWIRVYSWLVRTGLLKLAAWPAAPRWRRLLELGSLLSTPRPRIPSLHPARRSEPRVVQLFIGCVASQSEPELIDSALYLLNHLGFTVEIPETQACCGALHRHNGFPERAETMRQANRRQTGNSRAEALITLASACHLELLEGKQSQLPVVNLVEFLLGQPATAWPPIAPLKQRVALHTPCTAAGDRSLALLQRIPAIEVVELPENDFCCGAAGSYLFTQPDLSGRLGQPKIRLLKESGARILVTGNTGCALQFRHLIREASLEVEVLHPAQLFARQLPLPERRLERRAAQG